MIIIDKEKKFFHLRTKKMSYVFRILKNGSLGHLYYGEPLAENENFDYLINDDNKAAGTIKYYQNDSKFSLGAQTSEFNINGTSDFRQPAIEFLINYVMVNLHMLNMKLLVEKKEHQNFHVYMVMNMKHLQ